MSKYKHILTDFKDLRKVIGEVTKSQPAKSRYQQQAEKMKYRAEAKPKDDKDGTTNKKPDHAGEEEIKKAYLALGKSAQGSLEFQRGLVQKQLAKMGYKTYSKQAFSDLFGVEVESNDLDEGIKVGDNIHLGFGAKGGTGFKGKVIKIDGNIIHIKNPEGKKYKGPMKFVTKEEVGLDEWTISDVERAMKKKYGKVDKDAIAKLKKVQHMGNVDRNALVKVGHGKLLVQSVEINEALAGDVKKWFAKKGLKGIKVKTVSGKNPFMQVTKGSNDKIPNDIIKKAIILQYDKMPSGVRDVNKIAYGNFNDRMFSLGLDKMAKLVKEEIDLRERSFSIKNKKTGQVYASGKYPFSKNHLEKIRKAGGDHKHAAFYKDGKLQKEEVDLDEWKMGDGRPRGASHIENIRFWDLPKDQLEYIIKDAGKAMKANPTARKATSGPGNWADQVNDAATVLGWRKKNRIKEDVDLDEGRMKELDYYIKQGKSAEWIAKKMKVDLKTIKAIIGEEFIPSRSKQVKEEHEQAKQSPFKLKSQQYPRAIPIKTDGYGNRHATVEDIITACDSFGMIIDKELQVEQVQKELGKKGFITYKKSELEDIFESRETVRIILALESDIEEQTPIEYTRSEVQYALDERHEIEFLKPDGTKSIGPVLKLSGNTFNVKDKYTGKSFTYKYSKIEEEKVKTFNEVSKERGPKQLTNPNKEVMVVKKNRVVVISKKDKDKYLKQGWSLAEEINLDEAGVKTKHGYYNFESIFETLLNKYKSKYLKYSDLLLKKARLVAQGPITSKEVAAVNKEIAKEMKKLGISEETNLDEWISNNGTRRRVKERDQRKYNKLKEWEDAAEATGDHQKASGDKEAYEKFFNKVLKKFGVSSPAELEGEKKKEFFNYIDKNWKADHEEVDIHKSYRVDGRRTNFREKMRALGYIKSKY